MPTAQNAVLLNHLDRLVGRQRLELLADRELLQRFARDRDEGALETLLRRHGPMVMGVCRRLLSHPHDAEDAFQATFLVLTNKAAALGRHESVAAWLHEVAQRVALKVRGESARRRFHEARAPERLGSDPLTEITGRELVGALDEELARLGANCRVPLVLCYLEGLTQDEAARRLGLSLSTIKRRLERGRERLRIRLTKRGLALSAALSVCALSPTIGSALPPTLLKSTILAAASIVAGNSKAAGLVSAHVAALTQGVIKAMFVSRLTTLAMTFLTISAVAVGSGAVALHRPAQAADSEQVGQTSPQEQKSEKTQQDKPPTDSLRETREIVSGDTKDAKTDVLSLAFSHDGKRLASVNAAGVATVWDIATGKALAAIGRPKPDEKMPGYFGGVLTMQFALDDEPLAAGQRKDGTVWFWKLDRTTNSLELNHPLASGAAISPDGKLLILADEGNIYLTNISTAKVLWKALRIAEGRKELRSGNIAFSPDGKVLAGQDGDRRTVVFDASSGKMIGSLDNKGPGAQAGLAFSPDGKTLAIGADTIVNLWDVGSGKLIRSFGGRHGQTACVAFSPDGKVLVAGTGEGVLRLLDANTGAVAVSIHAHKAGITAVAFSPDGKTVATGSTDGVIKLWNWQDQAIRVLGQGDNKGANFVTFTDKGTVQGGDRIDVLLGDLIKAKRTDDQIIEALYLATLARLPTEIEKGFALKHLGAQSQRRQDALSDLVFSLTQTQEFRRHLEALGQRASTRPKE
jgi:RNA polymerase sigma factor (sigma-70 family)